MSEHLPIPDFTRKIVSFEDLRERASELPHPIVMTNGVSVNSDASVRMLGKGDDRPINTEQDRAAVLAALESVSLVTVFTDKVPLKAIEAVRPDIYVKGGDYRVEDLPEAKLVSTWGGKALTISFEYERSTTSLLERVRKSGGH